MNRFWMPVVAIAAAASFAASAQSSTREAPSKSYYYWLHPKLGMVKVDRKTNAMIVGGRVTGPAAAPPPVRP